MKIKSFVEEETDRQYNKLQSTIKLYENELDDIELINIDNSYYQEFITLIENGKTKINDENKYLPLIVETTVVLII